MTENKFPCFMLFYICFLFFNKSFCCRFSVVLVSHNNACSFVMAAALLIQHQHETPGPINLIDTADGVVFDFEKQLPPPRKRTAKRKEICQAYQQGQCKLGEHCPERHLFTSHRTVQLEVCKHWLRGACVNGDNCAYLHEYDERFVPECAFYQRLGECTNPECPFRHINPAEKTPLCAAYQRGFCPAGPQCRLRHQQVAAASVCAYYLLGFCPLGPKCPKVHVQQLLYHRSAIQERCHKRTFEEKRNDPSFNRNHICHKCGDLGHLPRSCPGVVYGQFFRATMAVQEPGENPTFYPDGRQVARICYGCGREGHESKDCPNRQRQHQQQGNEYPPRQQQW